MLLTECSNNTILTHIKSSELLPYIDSRDGHKLSMRLMVLKKPVDIHIRNPVTVCEHKRLIAYILLHLLYSSACHSLKPCVHQSHLPRLRLYIVDYHIVSRKVKGDI